MGSALGFVRARFLRIFRKRPHEGCSSSKMGAVRASGEPGGSVGDPSASVCDEHGDLFFGTSEDGRMEEGRVERETLAASVCFSCPVRLRCLEKSVVLSESYGVWGGMGEGERRRFVKHIRQEGYRHEVPTGDELAASVYQFYRTDSLVGS